MAANRGRPSPNDAYDAIAHISDEDLRLTDLPQPRDDVSTYDRFALTTNGYERMGSFEECAALANAALEHWRMTRTVPTSLRDLRCSLFFETRRWRFGDGFDEEAISYSRDLVDAMRTILLRRDGPPGDADNSSETSA